MAADMRPGRPAPGWRPGEAAADAPRGRAAITAVRAAVLAAVLLAGCSGHAQAGPARTALPQRTAAVPAASRVPPESVKAQALGAYLGMWRAYVAASRTGDYQSTALARYAAGDALSVLTHGLYDSSRQGIVTRGQPSFRPQATVAYQAGAPVSARVSDCASDSRWRAYYKSGKPVPGGPGGRRRITARLVLFYGTWKATYLVVGKAGTC